MTTHTPLRCAYSGMVAQSGKIVLLNSGNYPSFSSYLNETWVWNGSNGNEDWTNLSTSFIDPSGPLGPNNPAGVVMSARINQAMAFDGTNVMCFGGQGSSSTAGAFNDTWTFNGTTWTLQHPALAPSVRYGAEAAYLAGTGAVMFGGQNAGWILEETWVWNGTTWAQVAVANGAGPAARLGHAMAGSASAVVMFGGGGTSNNLFNDTWAFNGTSWTQLGVSGPSVRTGACMAYDSHNSLFVLFGGQNGQGSFLNDTWVFNGTTWTYCPQPNVAGAAPAGRIGAEMAFDTANNLTIMFGGWSAASNYPSNDTWAFNGATLTWTKM